MQINRREFLRVGAIPFLGLSLPQYLRAEPSNKKSVIFFFLWGGPSHIDTYDPKPEAPEEIRGAFGASQTKVPGFILSSLFPEQAKVADKLSVIRSFSHRNNDHEPAQLFVISGQDTLTTGVINPSFGSVSAKLVSGADDNYLPNVFLGSYSYNHRHGIGNTGFISPKFKPKFIDQDPNNEHFAIKDLELAEGLTIERLMSRKELLQNLDNIRFGSNKIIGELDAHVQEAFKLLTNNRIAKAFEINQEEELIRNLYGRTEIGQRTLLARRLVEAGVHFVTVEYRPESSNGGGWDYHSNIFKWMPVATTPFDQAVATLITDLDRRGLLASTLVLALGEFGRTYKVNKDAGRDHQPEVGSVLIAGGGVPGGQIYGASDSRGASVKSLSVSPADLLATIYNLLGFPPDTHLYDKVNRRILISEGKPLSL